MFQGDYIRHPVLYELSHKYGLPTENISDSQLSSKLEELKEIIRREIRKELKIKEGAEKLRGVSTDRRSLSHVATIVKNSNWKLAELKNELSELESQIILSQGQTPSTPSSNGGKETQLITSRLAYFILLVLGKLDVIFDLSNASVSITSRKLSLMSAYFYVRKTIEKTILDLRFT